MSAQIPWKLRGHVTKTLSSFQFSSVMSQYTNPSWYGKVRNKITDNWADVTPGVVLFVGTIYGGNAIADKWAHDERF